MSRGEVGWRIGVAIGVVLWVAIGVALHYGPTTILWGLFGYLVGSAIYAVILHRMAQRAFLPFTFESSRLAGEVIYQPNGKAVLVAANRLARKRKADHLEVQDISEAVEAVKARAKR